MERDFKKEVVSYVEGYKHLNFIRYCLRYNPMRLEAVYGKELTGILKTLHHYVRYQMNDYYLYTRIGEAINSGPLVVDHGSLDLEAYVKGIYERNKLVWYGVDYECVFDFLVQKDVLDFGCGGGFYTEIFKELDCRVLSYDKPDIADLTNKWKPEIQVVSPPFEALLPLVKEFDVVWISEVLHGKSLEGRTTLTGKIVSNMKKGGLYVINELKPDTPLSMIFDYQMKIHGDGKLLRPIDMIVEMERFNVKYVDSMNTEYHTMLIFERG